jgi:hypothetical protein
VGVVLHTGCSKCGMSLTITAEWCNCHLSESEKLRSNLQMCESCFERYLKKYSKEAIRDRKINSLLKKDWWRIF